MCTGTVEVALAPFYVTYLERYLICLIIGSPWGRGHNGSTMALSWPNRTGGGFCGEGS